MKTTTPQFETVIYSNGSKWAGQEPDSIERLIEVLKTETIEERFFHKYLDQESDEKAVWKNLCPISTETSAFYGDSDNMTVFFGNFEGLSHVFRIASNDPEIIERLANAIKKNAGWAKYYEKNLVK